MNRILVLGKKPGSVIKSIRVENENPNEQFNLGALILLKTDETIPDTQVFKDRWSYGDHVANQHVGFMPDTSFSPQLPWPLKI